MDKNDFITLECKLIKAGVPTLNGRIYTIEAFEKACEDVTAKKSHLLGCLGEDIGHKVQLNEVSHEAHNLRVNSQGRLVADIQVLDTEQGDLLKAMFESKESLTLHPCFHGVIGRDNTVEDITMSSVNICLTPNELKEEQNVQQNEDTNTN